jgi:hypothetical protein
MRILVFDSGVEMWKVTLSKSETTWSIETGAALVYFSSAIANEKLVFRDQQRRNEVRAMDMPRPMSAG